MTSIPDSSPPTTDVNRDLAATLRSSIKGSGESMNVVLYRPFAELILAALEARSSSPSATPDDVDLTRNLDDFQKATEKVMRALRDARFEHSSPEIDRATEEQSSTRSAILDAFSRIREERDRERLQTARAEAQKAFIDMGAELGRIREELKEARAENERLRDIYSVCPNCDASWTNGEIATALRMRENEVTTLASDNRRMGEELAALRSSTLTPEEARKVREFIVSGTGSIEDDILEKLWRWNPNQ